MADQQGGAKVAVTADGIEMGRFDTAEEAQDFADLWNGVYQHDPWFVVEPSARQAVDPDA